MQVSKLEVIFIVYKNYCTIKITANLLFEYQCTSGKFISLANRIESKLFLPELECCTAYSTSFRPSWCHCYTPQCVDTCAACIRRTANRLDAARWDTETVVSSTLAHLDVQRARCVRCLGSACEKKQYAKEFRRKAASRLEAPRNISSHFYGVSEPTIPGKKNGNGKKGNWKKGNGKHGNGRLGYGKIGQR